MNESKQRKTGVILSYALILVNTAIQLVFTPVLIRMLGQSEYGLYSLINSIIGYLTILDFGFGNAIIVYTTKYRALNQKEQEKKLHGMFRLVFLVLALIAVILGFILFLNTENIFSSTMNSDEIHKAKIMMLILTFNLGITFAFTIYSSIISAYERFTFQKIVALLNSLIKPIIMLPMLFLGFKSISMCIIITLVNVVVLLSNYVYCVKKLNISIKYKGFDAKLFKTILGYSIWIFLAIVVDKVNYSVDNFILGAISGTVAVSVYSIASTLDQSFINLSSAMSSVFLPKMTKMVSQKASAEKLTAEFIKIGRLQFYLLFLVCSAFILLGKNFIYLWAGSGFEDSYYITLLLILPGCVPLIQNIGLSIMQAMNKYKFKAISTSSMSIFNIIISIFLARKYGAIGAAVGTCLSLVICNCFLINIYYYKVIKLDVIKFWKNIFKMLIRYIVPFAFMVLLIRSTNLTGIYNLVVYGIVYTLIYFVVSYFFVFNDYEKKLCNSFFSKLFRLKNKKQN